MPKSDDERPGDSEGALDRTAVIPIVFPENATLEEKKNALNHVVESVGGKEKVDKNAKPTDKKTFELTRDDACGLAYMQTDRGRKFMDGQGKMMVTNHSVLMDLMSWALNRPVWNFETPSEELEVMFNDLMKNWEKRYGKDSPQEE
jgi:hypothetical protein